jgi:hypothetical protein
MATALKTKPGINGANTLSIPTEWDATWFRKFIANSLKGADVRNAIAGTGISITGNISSPYATISATGAGGITSVLGTTNQIVVNTVAGVATVSLSPTLVLPGTLTVTGSSTLASPVVINPTAGQVSLTVTGASGQEGAIFNGAANGDAVEVLGSSSSGQSFGLFVGAGTTSADYAVKVEPQAGGAIYLQIKGDGSGSLGPSGSLGLSWGSAGNMVIAAPTSGAAITVTANAASQIGIFNGPLANAYFDYQNAGTLVGRIGSSDSITVGGASSDFAITAPNGSLVFGTVGSTQRLVLGSAGGLILDAPTGGNKGIGTINVSGGYYVNGVSAVAVTGAFTAGTTGLSAATIAAKYTINGNAVTLFLAKPSTIVSNATTFTITGLPAAIQPTTAKYAACNPAALNASSFGAGFLAALVSGSTITLTLNGSTWTATGNKNYADAVSGATFVYDLT